jgi:hypothetical protein
MRLLLSALARTPLPLLYAYGRTIDFFLFNVFRWRRNQVATDIAHAFPDRSPDGVPQSFGSPIAISPTS